MLCLKVDPFQNFPIPVGETNLMKINVIFLRLTNLGKLRHRLFLFGKNRFNTADAF
ncbi:hypothetical protein D3C73_1356190 [compost metagenome]